MPSAHPSTSSGFDDLGLDAPILKSITALGYEEPTPVQRETIPVLLSGTDLLAMAATGTGRPAAGGLPIMQEVAVAAGGRKRRGLTRASVLVPRRELALQVAEALHEYARGTVGGVVPLYGGGSMLQQTRALERGAD